MNRSALPLLALVACCAWAAPAARAQAPGWTVDPSQYANAMSMTVQVNVDGVPSYDADDLIAAFVGDEVRGVKTADYIPPLDAYRFVQTIYSNTSGETVTFRFYDASDDVVLDVTESITFVTDAIEGSIGSPIVLTASAGSGSEDPALAVVPLAPAAPPGGTFVVDVRVGDPETPVSGLFGVGFQLHYDPAVLTPVSWEAGSFFPAASSLWFADASTPGTVAYSITLLRDQHDAGLDGVGAVARVAFIVHPDPAGEVTALSLSDVLAVHADGSPLPLRLVGATVPLDALVDVWPGDTDDDSAVDEADVLPLGVHFGQTGPARADASLAWVAQPAALWAAPAATFADATGDGMVNQNDLLAVGVNFGRARGDTEAASPGPGGPALTLGPLPVGTTVAVDLLVGHPDAPLAGVLGVAARLALPLDVLAVRAVAAGGWLGDGDVLAFHRVLGDADAVAAAVTRKGTNTPTAGHGAAITFTLEIVAEMDGPAEVRVLSHEVGAADGTTVPAPATLELGNPVAGEPGSAASGAVRLEPNHPNPFRGRTAIGFTTPQTEHVRVTVFDVRGRVVATLLDGVLPAGRHEVEWAPGALTSGVYFCRIVSASGTAVRPVMLLR